MRSPATATHSAPDLRPSGPSAPRPVAGSWPFSLLLRVLAVVILLYSSTAFLFFFRPEAAERPEGDTVVQLLWLPLYAAVAVAWLFVRGRGPLRDDVDRWLLAFVALAAASFFWSQAPPVTARRTIALGTTILCGMFLAKAFTVAEVLRLFRLTVLIAAAGSILILIFLPEEARDPLAVDGAAIRGAFIAKNLFGRMMVLGLCAELLLYLYARGNVFVHAATMTVLGALLVLSGSATSALVLVAVWGVILFIRWARTLEDPQAAVGVLLVATGVTVVFVTFLSAHEVVLRLVGRDATLTNRTRIWDTVLIGIRQQPLLGYGFGAFWRGNFGPSGIVFRAFNAPIGHAHNGFLEIWAQVGLVGLAIAGVLLIRSLRDAVRLILSNDVLLGATSLGFLTFLLLFNLDESALLVQNSLYTILFAYLISAMASGLRDQQHVEGHL